MKKVSKALAATLAWLYFDETKQLPASVFKKKREHILILDATEHWNSLADIWTEIHIHREASHAPYYLTTAENIRGQGMEDKHYEIDCDNSSIELMTVIEEEGYFGMEFFLELYLFSGDGQFLIYFDLDLSYVVLATDDIKLKDGILSGIKKRSEDRDVYLGDNFNDFISNNNRLNATPSDYLWKYKHFFDPRDSGR